MSKVQKSRVTVSQFDTALMEEIQHTRGMNVQTNMVSNATMFTLMLRKRIFGDAKMPDSCSVVISRLMEDAKAERAAYEQQQRQAAREAEHKVLLPGDPRFNPRRN